MSTIDILKEEIKNYVETADEKTLEVVYRVLEACDPDPFENMSELDKASLELSLKQADEGNTIPHEEVWKEYKKWLTK